VNEKLALEVTRWIENDPDEHDRTELRALLDEGDEEELRARFAAPLHFGTAGLRGPELAGPSGMNRLTVRRATQGVIEWLETTGADVSRGVVVGRDARHGSETFNDEVVAVLLGAGVPVFEMPGPLPTPFVPYVVKAQGLVAGVMITASHNPARDNGYKLYDESGSQIIAPTDAIVERAMASPPPVTLGDRSSALHHVVSAEVLANYRRHMLARFAVGSSDLAIAYTPLHGVGGAVTIDLLAAAGFQNVVVCEEQFAPDGDFPTLAFPNPEEPGALELAIRTANAAGSSLVIANDPDADRLGVAVRVGVSWRALRGDEIGWLLASGLLPGAGPSDVVATSIVSSSLLSRMARAANLRFEVTLTGFKWVARAAGNNVLRFGYEEALGFAVDPSVADKDGISAALALCQLAHELAQEDKTLLDRLDEIEGRFGVHAGAQLSFRRDGAHGLEEIESKIAELRENPPGSLGGAVVTDVVDLANGFRGLPATPGLFWELGDVGRVVVRPSGTEPKMKAYVEVVVTRDAARDLRAERSIGAKLLARVSEDVAELLAIE
jgi:phosphomannomutase